MQRLRELIDRLIVRSHEAIMQLDLSIQRRQRLLALESGSKDIQQLQEYFSYFTYLNELNTRSKYFREKLVVNEGDENMDLCLIMEGLIMEFENITKSLNELALEERNLNISPVSNSTVTTGSFQPRVLKIIERNKSLYLLPSASSSRWEISMKHAKVKHVNFGNNVNPPSQVRSSSLPGSPTQSNSTLEILARDEKSLRMVKSYDVGLNQNQRKSVNRLNFFKENQRLSISVFDEDVYDTDDETVISVSPSIEFNECLKVKNLSRRYSFDEIIQGKKQAQIHGSYDSATNYDIFPSWIKFPIKGLEHTSITYRHAYYGSASPCYYFEQKKCKDLLFQCLMPQKGEYFTHHFKWFKLFDRKRSKIFSEWNSFSNKLLVTSETGVRISSNILEESRLRPCNKPQILISKVNLSCSTLTIGPNGSKFINKPPEPTLNRQISYDELQDALNTKFIF